MSVDDDRPRLLLIAESEHYAPLRALLSGVHEVTLGSALFEEGTLAGLDRWRVLLPLSVDRTAAVRDALLDARPALVVLFAIEPELEEIGYDATVIVADEIWRWNLRRMAPQFFAGRTTLHQPSTLKLRLTAALQRGAWRARFPAYVDFDRAPANLVEGGAHLMPPFVREVATLEVTSVMVQVIAQAPSTQRAAYAALADLLGDALATWAPEPWSAPTASDERGYDGYLRTVSLSGIRGLPAGAWRINGDGPGWHVVLGANASGKSTMLKAIALALLDPREREKLGEEWNGWLSPDAVRGEVRVTVGDERALTPVALEFTRVVAGAHVAVIPRGPEGVRFAGFAASYGPFRRFGRASEWRDGLEAQPVVRRHLSLFDPRCVVPRKPDWLDDLYYHQERNPDAALFTRVERLLDVADLPSAMVLGRREGWLRLLHHAPESAQPLNEGRDGLVSLTLDLLGHLATHVGLDALFDPVDPTRVGARGVVLIDEVDAHLDPAWQRRVRAWLTERFPRVQFIVTTHSALVSEGADSVWQLPDRATALGG